jgi:hypothetical protein
MLSVSPKGDRESETETSVKYKRHFNLLQTFKGQYNLEEQNHSVNGEEAVHLKVLQSQNMKLKRKETLYINCLQIWSPAFATCTLLLLPVFPVME